MSKTPTTVGRSTGQWRSESRVNKLFNYGELVVGATKTSDYLTTLFGDSTPRKRGKVGNSRQIEDPRKDFPSKIGADICTKCSYKGMDV